MDARVDAVSFPTVSLAQHAHAHPGLLSTTFARFRPQLLLTPG